MNNLFQQPLSIINIGLENFAQNIQQAGGTVQHLHWQPPAQGDKQAGLTLATLINCSEINQANQIALSRYLASQPVLVDILPAGKAIPQLIEKKRILHAGPLYNGMRCVVQCKVQLSERFYLRDGLTQKKLLNH
ncbi:hypothetical protein [Avibacterium paragallinarum]|uniref:hypothetical protein n=1 Tax=Avibacterium paragallinarum TaxID=728 RepID=UPI001B30A603|nr:hypothetical protein [Avibacterium paragallinarum]